MKTYCRNGHEWTPENTRQTAKRRYCRACERAWFAAHAEQRRPYRAAWMRAYTRTSEGRIKRLARAKVQWAVKKGALIRRPCEKCGSPAEAHHDDYAKPLDVRWLCNTHHDEWHRLNGEGAFPPLPENLTIPTHG